MKFHVKNEHTEKECPQCMNTFSVAVLKQHLKNTKCRPNYNKQRENQKEKEVTLEESKDNATTTAENLSSSVEDNIEDDSVSNITNNKDKIGNSDTAVEVKKTKIVPSFVISKEELVC